MVLNRDGGKFASDGAMGGGMSSVAVGVGGDEGSCHVESATSVERHGSSCNSVLSAQFHVKEMAWADCTPVIRKGVTVLDIMGRGRQGFVVARVVLSTRASLCSH